MSIFKSIIGSVVGLFTPGSSAAEKVLDGAVRGIDALVFTDEERSVARQRVLDNWLELQKSLGAETTTRSITRRILAILILVPFVLLIMSAAVVYAFDPAYAQFLVLLAQGNFGMLAMGVGAFYFGPYMLSYLQQPKAKA
jgi:hypothetical protein